jgi:hypothetical protein
MINRLAIAMVALVALAPPAWAQSDPGLVLHQVPTAAQWNSYFAAKQDYGAATPISPKSAPYNATCNGVADDTTALRTAIATGRTVLLPDSSTCIVSGTLTMTTANQMIMGSGPASIVKLKLAAGAPVVPVIDMQSTAVGASLFNFGVDGGNGAVNLIQNTVYGANIIAGSAILIQANDSSVAKLNVRNGWDNCVAVTGLQTDGTQNSGVPNTVSVNELHTNACGLGSGAGSGLDLASVRQATASNIDDNTSAGGALIIDIGAGAQVTATNIASQSPTKTATVNSGLCMYIGSGDSSISNVQCNQAAGPMAIWFDGFTTKSSASNINVKFPAKVGILIKSPDLQLTNVNVDNAGQTTGNTYDAYVVDSSANAITKLSMVNTTATGTSQRYGYSETGGNTRSVSIIGSNAAFTGATAGFAPGISAKAFQGTTLGWNMTGALGIASSTVAALPTCNAGAKYQILTVSDALGPAWNATVAGGGAVAVAALCDGAAWKVR